MDALRDLQRGWRLRGDSVPYALSNALRKDLYLTVRTRGVKARTFRHELNVLLADAIVTRTPPDWVVRRRDADAYLVAADLVCPLQWEGDELQVLTVLRAPSGDHDFRRIPPDAT